MKTLVAFYSRSGNTKKIAQKIADNLNADIDEIFDNKNRKGVIGWLGGGKDAMKKAPTTIKNGVDPEGYDMVIVGTPIWVGTATPAIRAYLSSFKMKKVAFFCTCGDKQTTAWDDMKRLSSSPVATLEIKDKNVKTDGEDLDKKIVEFCSKL